jgi:hypothetical protein
MLADFQEALVALATDRALLKRYRVHGGEAFAHLSLDAGELRTLGSISTHALERYARSLVAKRCDEVARTVPLTRRLVPEVGNAFRAWAAAHPMAATDGVLTPGAAEALRALDAMRHALSSPRHAAYAADLYAFEVLAACSRVDGAPRTMSSRWHMGEIAAEIAKGLLPIDPIERAMLFRFEHTSVRWRDG